MDPAILHELGRLGIEFLSPEVSDDFQRPTASYSNQNDRFILKESGYERQFVQTYFCRYHQLKIHAENAAKQNWPNTPILPILGVKEKGSDEVVVCGILFKSMKLKPQILDKYLANRSKEKELQNNKNRVADDDELFLEDEGTRTRLTGDTLRISRFVSGICLAIKGRQLADGKFEVYDFCYPSMAPQSGLPMIEERTEKYVAFVSGLNLGETGPRQKMELDLLVQYLKGQLENGTDRSHQIVRIVVCGGLVGKNEDLATGAPNSRKQLRSLGPIKQLDAIIEELVEDIAVDVMPGLYDPATFLMPQQSMHRCLFPKASTSSSFSMATNPHTFTINDIRFLGTSGQNVHDILLHSDQADALEALESCLLYRHIAPTCPDTLSCFPFIHNDPFVLEETPHVLFAGNQASFQTKCIIQPTSATRLICIPEFNSTSEIVLLHLNTMEPHLISFDASHIM